MGIVVTDWKACVLRRGGLRVAWPRREWFVLLAILGLVIGLLANTHFFVTYMAVVLFFLGMRAAEKGDETTQKSVSFCLPGYRESLRLRHLMEGVLIGLGLALWFLSQVWLQREIRGGRSDFSVESPWPRVPEPVGTVLATVGLFIAATATYQAIRGMGYSRRGWLRGIDTLAGTIGVLVVVYLDVPQIVWSGLLPVWLAIGVFSWIRLGDIGRVRESHRMLIRDGLHPDVKMPAKGRAIEYRVDMWFRRRMERHAYLSAGRYYWDELHWLLRPILCYWRTELVWLAAGALVVGFLGEAIAGLGFVIFGLVGLNLSLPLVTDHTLLLPAGRSQRCLATMLIGAGASAAFSVFGVVVITLSWLLGLLIGALPLIGSVAFLAIDPAWFYWPCLLVPWTMLAGLFRGWLLRIAQGGLVVAALLLAAGVYLLHYHVVPAWSIHAAFLGVLVAGWALLLAALRMSYRTCDIMPARAWGSME